MCQNRREVDPAFLSADVARSGLMVVNWDRIFPTTIMAVYAIVAGPSRKRLSDGG